MSRFEIKIVVALLLIAVIPLAASVYLVGQVIKVSDSVTEGLTQRLTRPLDRAAQAYRGLFEARKRTFRLQGQLMALDTELHRGLQPLDVLALERRLGHLTETEPDVGQMEVLDPGGHVVARRERARPFSATTHRHLRVELPLGEAPSYHLRLTFFTPRQPFEDFRQLGAAQRTSAAITTLRDELATYYRVVFLINFGAVALVATGLGLFISRRTTRRVAILAQATRRVAAGDLETRVHLRTRDELGDLARLFNEMVRQIKESGERITYLEKIGAWQDIARRLAHEIKNPLTPIQLAVQQLHRKYQGDDAAFKRMLDDARDIITEEVDGLRRLVEAFSAFAKLPNVQPEPVELGALVDDFLKSHTELGQHARIIWTPRPTESATPVLVDRMLIKHVLFNLVENAIHAAEERGTLDRLVVTLAARIDLDASRVELEVSDNGPGMDQATARRAFDPYFTTKERGTGLGLAIVKKIVLEHRGSIVLETAPGQGARFRLALPLAKAKKK
jgi:nitrogen fixation/metabolism regulation signal transduction histidine kinase